MATKAQRDLAQAKLELEKNSFGEIVRDMYWSKEDIRQTLETDEMEQNVWWNFHSNLRRILRDPTTSFAVQSFIKHFYVV